MMTDDVKAVLAGERPWGVMIGDALASLKQLPNGCVQCVVTSPPYFALRSYLPKNHPDKAKELGSEDSPQAYVARMVEVFRELRRVLRDDGVFFLNVADSYAGTGKSGGGKQGEQWAKVGADHIGPRGGKWKPAPSGWKQKDRMGIPHLLAFALRDDGWYFRDEIVWSKKSPMPMSVRDRTTPAHEFVFMFSKKPRYFYDCVAIAEPAKTAGQKIKMADGWDTGEGGHGAFHREGREKGKQTGAVQQETRNKRSVWRLSSVAYPGSHFATFPPKLVEPMILAGTSAAGCCPECGTPWVRRVERKRTATRPGTDSKVVADPGSNKQDQVGNRTYTGFNQRWKESQVVGNRDPMRHVTSVETLGWEPWCGCGGGLRADDIELIRSPTGERAENDPSIVVGRAGFSRPRGREEGTRLMTRYEQRQYAAQLKASPHRKAMRAEVGKEAFAHYVRTDRSGARPVPPAVLGKWIESGWLTRVEVPDLSTGDVGRKLKPIPCLILDPFVGSGTTLQVAVQHGRRGIGLDLDERNVALIEERMAALQPTLDGKCVVMPKQRAKDDRPTGGLLDMLDG